MGEIDAEDFRFSRRVVGIGRNCDFLVRMVVVSGVRPGRLGHRLDESFRFPEKRRKQSRHGEEYSNEQDTTSNGAPRISGQVNASAIWHGFDYRRDGTQWVAGLE
jgi:hypothetical protein